jgi:hypothetical protein
MSWAQDILQYYSQLKTPEKLPPEVITMNPYQNAQTLALSRKFYQKYYSDNNKRFICFGINPGRFGAGITGVPFTDPIRLEKACGIANSLDKKSELSSKFIYDMIEAYGGPGSFYKKFYISAVSPLGYIRDGINLNYYDIPGFKTIFETYAVNEIRKQLSFNLDSTLAYSIGKGQNVKFLNYLNDKHGFFGKIVPLSHPRWVMQYRLKRKKEYISEYLNAFNVE